MSLRNVIQDHFSIIIQQILSQTKIPNVIVPAQVPPSWLFHQVPFQVALIGGKKEPYVEYQRENCRSHKPTKDDVRLVGYEDVPSRDEEALRKAVEKNPVAIQLCGGPLQHYRGGIMSYDDDDCSINHEILTIGYGTDSETSRKYWLAKNSLGEQWGEDGYVRFLRGEDTYNELGVCKIFAGPHYPIVAKNQDN